MSYLSLALSLALLGYGFLGSVTRRGLPLQRVCLALAGLGLLLANLDREMLPGLPAWSDVGFKLLSLGFLAGAIVILIRLVRAHQPGRPNR